VRSLIDVALPTTMLALHVIITQRPIETVRLLHQDADKPPPESEAVKGDTRTETCS
jgi:hypothetical protein